MSQLRDQPRRKIAVVAMCAMTMLAGAGCATTVAGQAQSPLPNRIQQLHDRVDGSDGPEAKYKTYWGEVCDTLRELDPNGSMDDYSVNPLTDRYINAVLDYYYQLVDDKQLPDDAFARDGGRFIAGRDVCDFAPTP